MAQVRTTDSGQTFTLTGTRADMIAVAAALENTGLVETSEILRLLVGSPPWQRAAGEGTDGPITRGELTEFQQAHGLPTQGV